MGTAIGELFINSDVISIENENTNFLIGFSKNRRFLNCLRRVTRSFRINPEQQIAPIYRYIEGAQEINLELNGIFGIYLEYIPNVKYSYKFIVSNNQLATPLNNT